MLACIGVSTEPFLFVVVIDVINENNKKGATFKNTVRDDLVICAKDCETL